jgi:hypothetical protein
MNAVGAWASTLTAFGMWWLTTQAFFINAVAGLPFAESMKLVFLKGDTLEIFLPWQMVFYLVAGLIAGAVASLLSDKPEQSRLDLFYALIRTPVTIDEEVKEPCTLPEGSVTPPARKMFRSKSFEIYVPSKSAVAGFSFGWLCVIVLIAVVFALVK